MKRMSKKTDDLELITYIPKNCPDLNELCNHDMELADSVRIIFHQVYRVKLKEWSYGDLERKQLEEGGWVSLCSEILSELIDPDKYRPTLDFMIDNGLLDEKMNGAGFQSYAPLKCKKFRIPNKWYRKFERGHMYRKEIVKTKLLVKHVRKHLESSVTLIDYTERTRFQPQMEQLVQMTKTLCPDKQGILSFCNGQVNDPDMEWLLLLAEDHNEPLDESIFTDEFGQRFFSHVTNLKSDLRKFYRFKKHMDQPHIMVDFKNSQPFFLGLILRYPRIVKKFLPEFNTLIPLLEAGSEAEDTVKFFELVQTGTFYEFMLEKLSGYKMSRKQMKQNLFRSIFYGPVKLSKDAKEYEMQNAFRTCFESEFPTVYKTIMEIKSVGKARLPFMDQFYYSRYSGKYLGDRGSYKNLSNMMQRIEARIVTGAVTNRLVKMRIRPFTTIHDSFWTIASNEENVKRQLSIFFARYKVPEPQFDTTYYHPETVDE